MKGFIFLAVLLTAPFVHADRTWVLTSPNTLRDAKIEARISDEGVGVALAYLAPLEIEKLRNEAHKKHACAGFEVVDGPKKEALTEYFSKITANLRAQAANPGTPIQTPAKKSEISAAVAQVSIIEIRKTVEWLSSFPNRYHQSSSPDAHVTQFAAKLRALIASSKVKGTVDIIPHRRTSQSSVRVHIEGTERPSEIVVLGAHLDSINQYSFFGSTAAPGADDNASGSSALLEAMRVFLMMNPPQRSVEFFWYAGEEGGLLGSAEIAEDYKKQHKDVIAALQLDMTMFPGSGHGVMANIADFTSPVYQQFFKDLNSLYVGATIVDTKCDYACSDHASWYKAGYPSVFPFESSADVYNKNIHTTDDVIDRDSSFDHAVMFSKVSLAYALELSNSPAR